eukprot:scpid77493/ scgid11486/ 
MTAAGRIRATTAASPTPRPAQGHSRVCSVRQAQQRTHAGNVAANGREYEQERRDRENAGRDDELSNQPRVHSANAGGECLNLLTSEIKWTNTKKRGEARHGACNWES